MANETSLKTERIYDTVITLGNATEIGIQVMRELIGEEAYSNNSYNNLTNEQISLMIQNSIHKHLEQMQVENKTRLDDTPVYDFA